MNFLNKLRNQPVYVRKIILWGTMIIFALILGALWVYTSYKNIQNLRDQNIIENMNLPKLPELELPSFEILEFPTPNE